MPLGLGGVRYLTTLHQHDRRNSLATRAVRRRFLAGQNGAFSAEHPIVRDGIAYLSSLLHFPRRLATHSHRRVL